MKPTGTSPCAPACRFRALWSGALIILAASSVPAGQALAAGKFVCSITDPGPVETNVPVTFTGSASGDTPPYTVTWSSSPDGSWSPESATNVPEGATTSDATFTTVGEKTVQMTVTGTAPGNGGGKAKTCTAELAVTVTGGAQGGTPTARGDAYATPVGKRLTVEHSRVSGVLYNDFDTDGDGNNIGNDGLSAVLVSDPAQGTLTYLDANGSFEYVPGPGLADNTNDSFTYQARDADGNLSPVATVNIHILSDQPDFKIMMNYELGMHCTGFEFSYCCILPPYNSIVAQVVKPQSPGDLQSNADFPRLLEGDPNNGLDDLGRETVLRDYDSNGNIHKYYLEYFHDAQPRREGNVGTDLQQSSTLISAVEGNSMLYHNTPYDSAAVDADGRLVRGEYNGVANVVVGNGDYSDPTDNFANGWMNHLYIYENLEGGNSTNSSLESDKIRLGVTGHIEYPADVGAALHPLGPTGSAPGKLLGNNIGPFDNVLTFSGETGTIVYTQAKVLENLPITLTSPGIWEALGLPLTPFEDSINFFAEPGAVDEDAIRPFVAMKARLHSANCDEVTGKCTKGPAVIGSNGQPVIGFGTAPIDIPNCERCHSAPAYQADGVTPNVNSPSYVRRQDGTDPFSYPHAGAYAGWSLEAITDLEINYWKSIYPSLTTGTDWYARLKGAAVNMLAMHDYDNGTSFLNCYPSPEACGGGELPGLPAGKAALLQNTRMGHGSVICQKCHGDNVIAAVNPLGPDAGYFLPPISEAVHNAHRAKSAGGPIEFADSFGRFGGCQGCHPAHRSDGVMDNYPITVGGSNANATGDNRLGGGGCFVGRDVHSNPLKDVDGAETPEHLNAVGHWLATNVGADTGSWRGIWCTNCHNQLSQEIWRAEDCHDLIHGECENDIRGLPKLADIAKAVGVSLDQAEEMLDPRADPNDLTMPYPGYGQDFTHEAWSTSRPDANLATIEVGPGGPVLTADADGDPSVNVLSFCTTDDCVARINGNKSDESQWRYPEGGAVDGIAGFTDPGNTAVAVPFDAATDGRDHWLAAGEPHCADCHEAPYVEQSGNISPFAPFNYPAKASLSRYTSGHQAISCQGCHESIHGLYPVGPAMDTTSYAQAAALNHDGSHGPLKCGTCHAVDGSGIPTWIKGEGAVGSGIGNFDDAVTWAHTYTREADVRNSTCQNCHGDDADEISAGQKEYLEHSMEGRTSRLMMDNAEIAELNHVLGATPGSERDQLCSTCHGGGKNKLGNVKCDKKWRQHLTQGRVSETVWEDVSMDETGTLCGW